MKSPLLFGVVLLIAPALLALDLTPTNGSRELEGFQVPTVTFSDTSRNVHWQPPLKWQLSGGESRLTLTTPEIAQATIELHVLQRPRDQRDQLATPEQRQFWTQRLLPRGSSGVAFKAENVNPFMLREQPTCEVILDYVFQARRLSASISFVDLNERERLALVVTSLPADFTKVHETAIASMFSWRWME